MGQFAQGKVNGTLRVPTPTTLARPKELSRTSPSSKTSPISPKTLGLPANVDARAGEGEKCKSAQNRNTVFEYPQVASVQQPEKTSFPCAGRFNRAAKTVMKQSLRMKTRPKTETYSKCNKIDVPKRRAFTAGVGQKSTSTSLGPSFASVVRIAGFMSNRKRSSARGSGGNSRKPEVREEEQEEAEVFELPEKIRYCCTLSLEAQYSFLKGYEELLRRALLKGRQASLTHSLVRVLTPKRRIVSMRAMDAEATIDKNVKLPPIEDPPQFLHPSKSQMSILSKKLIPNKPAQSLENSVSDDKRLRLTYRFETAMDLLDELQAESTTDEKHRSLVERFNSWNRNWSKEFQIEFIN